MQHYKQLDVQILIDLLAQETEQYIKTLSSGKQEMVAMHKANIDDLVTEITRRKSLHNLPSASIQGDFQGLSS